MQSEVAAMRARIEEECQALNNLTLFSSVASHETIRLAYKNVEAHVDELKKLVGEKKANDIACDIYCKVVVG